jgi:hypothetical protein
MVPEDVPDELEEDPEELVELEELVVPEEELEEVVPDPAPPFELELLEQAPDRPTAPSIVSPPRMSFVEPRRVALDMPNGKFFIETPAKWPGQLRHH